MRFFFPEKVDDFGLANDDPEWNTLQDVNSSTLTLELLARALRAVMRVVGSKHLNPTVRSHESRLVGLENQVNQDVRTTATPSFAAVKVGGVKVVGAQQSNWQPMSGTPNTESLYDVSTVTLAQLAARVKGIQDVLATHGMILEDI